MENFKLDKSSVPEGGNAWVRWVVMVIVGVISFGIFKYIISLL